MDPDINANFIPSSDTSPEGDKFVECLYKISGCKEMLEMGTEEMTEHIETCKFRPIPCLIQDSCKELVPYHTFLLHQMQHFLQPLFGSTLTTNTVFAQDDFTRDQRWLPRWINCYEKDFFFIVSHRIATEMWHFWVVLLGSQDEADHYYYDLEVCKGDNKKRGTYSVLSIRTPEESVETQEIAMSMTDLQVKRLSQIQGNLYGSFEIDLVIYKLKSSAPSRVLKPQLEE